MLAYMYNKEEPWLLGLSPNPRALAFWVKSVLDQNELILIIKNIDYIKNYHKSCSLEIE